MADLITEALDAYTDALKEADRFQQVTMTQRPAEQDWAQRDELDDIASRRRDALLVTIVQAINVAKR